ncbi:hypothetical protein H6A18_11085 [Collinsella tanakaei]|nr:hypothetical protein [Collinsella tanakaei]MBM6757040.1 hypothetical protein [Collinsella tanakaei]
MGNLLSRYGLSVAIGVPSPRAGGAAVGRIAAGDQRGVLMCNKKWSE